MKVCWPDSSFSEWMNESATHDNLRPSVPVATPKTSAAAFHVSQCLHVMDLPPWIAL
jgi:hypothetical protein